MAEYPDTAMSNSMNAFGATATSSADLSVNGDAPALSERISVRDVNFYYGDYKALKGISLPIYERKVTARWVGFLLRKKLRLELQRLHGVFVIPLAEGPKLRRLYEKYGLSEEEFTDDSPKETETQGLFPRPEDLGDLG